MIFRGDFVAVPLLVLQCGESLKVTVIVAGS